MEIQPKTLKNIKLILELLRYQQGDAHIRGIAKMLGINQGTVSRIIDNYLEPFVIVNFFDSYGFKAKLVRLKPEKEDTTLADVLRYIQLKRQIKAKS